MTPCSSSRWRRERGSGRPSGQLPITRGITYPAGSDPVISCSMDRTAMSGIGRTGPVVSGVAGSDGRDRYRRNNIWQKQRQPYFSVRTADTNPRNGWASVPPAMSGIPLWRNPLRRHRPPLPRAEPNPPPEWCSGARSDLRKRTPAALRRAEAGEEAGRCR